MANSKYEYVKSFEVWDEVMLPNFIVVRIDGRNFKRFAEVHGFERPSDERALRLMNCCALSVMEVFPDVSLSYGFSNEFSFVFQRTYQGYHRRASKLLSIIVSFFTSSYVTKWNDFFPETEMQYAPSFHGRVTCCATIEYLQEYLAWRQLECHIRNLYDTCFWMLVKQGKTEEEAKDALKDAQKQEKHELLFLHFEINYKDLPPIFRQGSFFLKRETEEIVKYRDKGTPVVRTRRNLSVLHVENIASTNFWNEQSSLKKNLGVLAGNIRKIRKESIRSFVFENKLMPSTWIVIRIDGHNFHSFTETHEFEKPNDMQALNLMNSCAMAVLEEFEDIIFAYGVSDEYSFVFRRETKFYSRQPSSFVSVIVSFFSSMYVMKWKTFFPQKELKVTPSFDGRAVCYPSLNILRDYLAWRQVDCHINNQYNTCFWMLVKSGKSNTEAQTILKGTQTREKNQLLKQQFEIDYATLPAIFRHGSSVFRDMDVNENGASDKRVGNVVIEYCNIVDPSFWEAHPSIIV